MLRQCFLWLLFSLVVDLQHAFADPAAPAAMRRVLLHTGESSEEVFVPGADLSVSRRGIVDVHHSGGGRWQLTAMRRGLVVIEARVKAEGTGEQAALVARLVVEVQAPKEQDSHASFSGTDLFSWVCATPRIRCDSGGGLVTGTTDDFRWLRRARRACATSRGCTMAVDLSASGALAWATELRAALGGTFAVEPLPGDRFKATALCGKDGRRSLETLADDLTGGAVEERDLVVGCREEFARGRYKLSARIFLVEASAATQLGFEGEAKVEFSAAPAHGTASVLSRLRALEAERRAEMVGEPVLRMAANEPVKVVSGGEFQVLEHATSRATEPRASWKRHGLEMSVTAIPLTDDTARLRYELSLSSKVSGSSPSLAVNSVASSIDLTLASPRVAALLDMKAEGRSTGITPVLAAVPLIGPLFRMVSSESASTRLVAWLELTADDDAGELK